NRIVMSPMCQYSSEDGFMNDWHMVHLGTRAAGGAGLIFTEATAVNAEGRITPSDAGIWKDEHIAGLKRIVDYIHQRGAMAGIQLAHAGRKASCAVPWEGGKQLGLNKGGWLTMAPSDIPFYDEDRTPQTIDSDGLKKVVADFREAALRALHAGFDIIEIHAAHGYLLHEFLSPLSNKRSDIYGGSFDNRTRILKEVTETVRGVVPEGNPLFVRISSTDWAEGGWSQEESVNLAPVLKEAGADLVDCSSGGNVHYARIPAGPGYQVPFSEAVRKAGIPTGAVGLITDPDQAESILQEGRADLIFLGRELLRNPYFALDAAKKLGDEIQWPVQYMRAR
ncbi:MAG TPA: NADH:flavin oxidoreductase/NADH oxidase, partial [Bacteroidales bacterium]|nr:NADH:flavin oxidoreductase/NADH oxidase [Bacteroidales bacterium]